MKRTPRILGGRDARRNPCVDVPCFVLKIGRQMNDVARSAPDYLEPYLDAARTHGGGFGSLLWASPQTQAARFQAIHRIIDLSGARVLDAGCGRADLPEFL